MRISLQTLDKLGQEGKIPYFKLGDGIRARVLYRRKDLDAFLERTRVDPKRVVREILDEDRVAFR